MEDKRHTGKTTRILNELVEEFFVRGEVVAVDHADTPRAHDNLLDRLITRLRVEHHANIKIDRAERKVSLITNKIQQR